MERTSDFILEQQIDRWFDQIQSNPSLTEDDWVDLKSHLLDLIDKLKKSGLDEEEAFWVASKRLGIGRDYDEEYQEANNRILQIRRSLIVLAGVMAYYFSYYFIHFTSKLLAIIMISSEISPAVTITWVTRYIATWYFIFAIFLVSIFLMENMAIALIDKIKMKPVQVIILLIAVIMFGIINTCLFPVIKNIIQPDMFPLSRLIHVYVLFDLAFPALIGVGFILIYLRYYRKTNTPG